MSETTFPLTRGLKQGSPSSPFLFTLMTDMILTDWRAEVKQKLQLDTLGIKTGPGKYTDCLCYVDDTLLLAKTSAEAAAMLEAFAQSLNDLRLELDVSQPGQDIDPNDPGAKMTAFCVNCQDEGVKLPRTVDPEERTCPYIRQGAWKWLGRLWDPEGTWKEDTMGRCNKAWAVFKKKQEDLDE